MAITVIHAGMLTTVQDLGRRGHRAAGVPLGGAMDAMAMRVVNLLVGNAEDAAVLEFTLTGPELVFTADTTIALGGGDFGAGPLWQPVRVCAGECVKFGAARTGCRGYLAVAGRWHIDERILPPYSETPKVRIVRGAQAPEFDGTLTTAVFKLTAKSDRMGVRLVGPALTRRVARELVSSSVVPGTVQVPPDGQPIVLMADAQTIGGYPQIAHVISVDLPLVAQLRPGDTLRFREVTLEAAHQLILDRERALALLREGLAQKIL